MATFNTTIGENLFRNSLSDFTLLTTDWMVGLLLTAIILLILTRNMERWAQFALPISILLSIAGVKIHLLQMVGTAVIFVISIMDANVLGNFIESKATKPSAIKLAQAKADVKIHMKEYKKKAEAEARRKEKERIRKAAESNWVKRIKHKLQR